ncbi:MAG: hypothetical protein ACRD4X_17190 [Candidatus Acidiferrales bacterium]
MANAITGAYQAHETTQINQTTKAANTTDKPAVNAAAAPQDTVTISKAGQAASQAHHAAASQAQQVGSDGDHGGK